MHLSDETLSRWVDGRLPTTEVAAARTHLGECAECRRALEELTAVVGLLGAIPDIAVPRDFTIGPRTLRELPRARQLHTWYEWTRAFAGAAAALFLVLVAASVYVGANSVTGASPPAAQGRAVSSSAAAQPAPPRAAAGQQSPSDSVARVQPNAAPRAAPAASPGPGFAAATAPPSVEPRQAPAEPVGGPSAPAPAATDRQPVLRLAGAFVGALAAVGLAAALLIRRRLRRAQAVVISSEEALHG